MVTTCQYSYPPHCRVRWPRSHTIQSWGRRFIATGTCQTPPALLQMNHQRFKPLTINSMSLLIHCSLSQHLLDSGPVPYASYNSVTFVAEQVSHHPPSKSFTVLRLISSLWILPPQYLGYMQNVHQRTFTSVDICGHVPSFLGSLWECTTLEQVNSCAVSVADGVHRV